MTFLDNEEGKQEIEKLNKVPMKVKKDANISKTRNLLKSRDE